MGRGPVFAITHYVSWYRSMVIFITVYRQYTQFVVSTTHYHILPFVATATHLSFFDILYIYIITRGHYIARKRSLHILRYCVQLYAIIPYFCTLHRSFRPLCPVHALFVHVLATFVHVKQCLAVLYYGHSQGQHRTHHTAHLDPLKHGGTRHT